MTHERQKLPKNAARVEFIPHIEAIKSILNSGFNIRNIYKKLCELHNLHVIFYFVFSGQEISQSRKYKSN
jgi:hypothetical protein